MPRVSSNVGPESFSATVSYLTVDFSCTNETDLEIGTHKIVLIFPPCCGLGPPPNT
jgi:hypothetical protein